MERLSARPSRTFLLLAHNLWQYWATLYKKFLTISGQLTKISMQMLDLGCTQIKA